jgi:serine/threonine-protein kinase
VLQQWLRRHLWRREFQQALLPAVGTTVGGYHLEARRGAGSHGTVYRARRGGRLYALKFIYLPRTGTWGWRELEVLLKLRRVGTLPLEGHGHWPDKKPLFLFLAMEYVDGRPLYAWARDTPLTGRQVARLVLALARQLVAVHSQGVVHRDVKGDNVLVRSADGVPVLVDFGVGTYAGAPKLTGPLLPGTAAYRNPEALRFRRERAPGERYEASGRDDLWALGVVLYRLLTGHYPFDGDEAALEDGILHGEPLPPRALNPRVPPALAALCLRMLAKAPEARCPDAQALCATLESLLEEARADTAWDVPLRQDWSPVPSAEPSSLEATPPGPTRTAPPTLDGREPRPSGVWLGATALALALVALLAALAPSPFRDAEDRQAPAPHGPFGQEMAPQWQTPQFDGGAAPPWAPTPAPVARATPPKDMRVKPSTPPPMKKPQQKRLGTLAKTATVAACTTLAGCASSRAARFEPPEDCPRATVEAMEKRLNISTYDYPFHASFMVSPRKPDEFITLRPGPVTMIVYTDDYKLRGDFLISGRVFVGEKHLYGRFTELRSKRDNSVYPVCMELVGPQSTGGAAPLGLELEPGSTPEAPRVFSKGSVRVVERFDERGRR